MKCPLIGYNRRLPRTTDKTGLENGRERADFDDLQAKSKTYASFSHV